MWQLVAPPAGSLITPYVRGLLGVGARGRGGWVGARGRAGCVWFHWKCACSERASEWGDGLACLLLDLGYNLQ